MNLPLPDHTLRTSCKSCVFAEYAENTQTNCAFGRIDKFRTNNKVIEAYDNEKEFYVISGLCNLNRQHHWNDGVADKDKAFAESSLTYKVYIDCTNLTPQFKDKIIQFVNNGYYTNKYNIILYHDLNVDKELKKNIIDIYQTTDRKIYITSCRDRDEYLHNSCLSAKESYVVNICNENDFDNDILTRLNNSINIDLKKALMIKNKDIYLISTTIYKIDNIDHPSNSYISTKESLLNKIQNTDLYVEL